MNTAESPSGHTQEQLIAIVAHELRYPLGPIRNAAALLRQESIDADAVRRAADVIERQASGMHRLIGDLVDVSRTQLGTLELRLSRVSLAELMELSLESAGPIATERGHALSVSVSPQPIYLNIDVLRLCQVLRNVIANASKYTDGNGYIHVRAQREGAEAVIAVSDTGIGIPEAELESIFGLFTQAGGAGRAGAGLGLGLYLARYLIESHGGTITAASKGLREGSEFTIRLACEVSTAPVSEGPDVARAGDLSPA